MMLKFLCYLWGMVTMASAFLTFGAIDEKVNPNLFGLSAVMFLVSIVPSILVWGVYIVTSIIKAIEEEK